MSERTRRTQKYGARTKIDIKNSTSLNVKLAKLIEFYEW